LGEVGRRLAIALDMAGWTVCPVTRREGWRVAVERRDPSPRIVAVREEQLGAVLQRFPAEMRERLVLVQNGFLEPVHGELGPVTRGLIYFTAKGDFFRVLCPSLFHGRHAAALAEAISRVGLATELLEDRASFLEAMIVKGIWNAVVGLPLAVHGVDLAGYLTDRRDELEALADESARACAAEYGVQVLGETAVQKILDTTAELGWVRGGKKALDWRNGAIARFGRLHGVATPVNDRLLREVGYDPDRPPAAS
jgi:ketopantoate reductase